MGEQDRIDIRAVPKTSSPEQEGCNDRLGVPPDGSRATPPSDDWTPSPGSPGWYFRTLLETQGYSTQLMRVEPGTISTPHAHDRIEQVYILEGDLYDDDGTVHEAGSFIVRAAGAVHSGGTRGGATMLVVYGDVGGDVR